MAKGDMNDCGVIVMENTEKWNVRPRGRRVDFRRRGLTPAPVAAVVLCASLLGCSSTIPTKVSDHALSIYSRRMERVQVGMSEKKFVKIWDSPYMPKEPFKIGLLESNVSNDGGSEAKNYTIGYWNYAYDDQGPYKSQYKKKTRLAYVTCSNGKVDTIQYFDADGKLPAKEEDADEAP